MPNSSFPRGGRLGRACAALALTLLLAACGSSSSTSGSGSAINVGNESVPASEASVATGSAAGTSSASEYPKGCTPVAAPKPEAQPHLSAPTQALDPSHHYTAVLVTNCGTIDIALAVHQAPKTAASFAYLVKSGFYNKLTFHRIVPGFVIQGGDPLGNGQGGPGYEIVEAPPANLKYQVGSVAMAKTATEPNGASGSQFFIVVGPQGAALPPQYALVGHVTGGLAAVAAISQVPVTSSATGTPAVPVVISSATLSTT
jgi:cyclophilin family peptidyl-prolyl cis-trans isomerase